MTKRKPAVSTSSILAERYPNIAEWVEDFGWIEIGRDSYSQSMVRALDEGGMIWEGATVYPSPDAALQALEEGIRAWRAEQGL